MSNLKTTDPESVIGDRPQQRDPTAFDATVYEWLSPEAALAARRNHAILAGIEHVQNRRIVGYVEVISAAEISGWAIDNEDAVPLEVYILVNNMPLVKVTADRERPDVARTQLRSKAGFKFIPGTDLRGLLPDSATISVRAGSPDGPELKANTGRISNPGCTSLDTLQSMLSNGFQISAKSGSLFRPIASIPGAFEQFITAYWTAEECFRRLFGLDLFVAYGTLLGLTRENALLAHDDDFDVAFCIDAKDYKDAALQFWKILVALKEKGEHIVEYADGHFHWKLGAASLDVFVWWRTESELNGYFLHATEPITIKPISVKRMDFQNSTVLAPKSSAELLAAIYGSDWQTPKPSFQWVVPDVVIARMGAFRSAFNEVSSYAPNMERPNFAQSLSHWNQFYLGKHVEVPSQFAVFVATVLPTDAIILELGCGNGRDAFFFANLGYHVLALDASKIAIDSNRRKACLYGGNYPRFEFMDISDTGKLEKLIIELSDKKLPLCIYSRFFIHAVDETVERNLITTVCHLEKFSSLIFVAEFRTTKDAVLPKEFGHHYRRYIDLSRFRHDLVSHGFKVAYAFEGQGMAKYKEEDPFVARVIAEIVH